jgi:hypothetical protein
MVEAGADEVPDTLLEARSRRRRSSSSAKRRRLREQARSRSGSTPELTASSTRTVPLCAPHPGARPARGRRRRRAARGSRRCRWTRRTRTSSSSSRCSSLNLLLEGEAGRRRGAVREAVRNDLRALTEAEQDSKELKSAKRHLLFERIIDGVELPFPVSPAPRLTDRRPSRHADQAVREAGGRGRVQGPRPQEDRRREAPARRARHRGHPADRVRSRSQPRTRLRAVHARADTDHDSAHARNGEGRSAHRRPVARVERRYMHHYNFRPTRSARLGSCAGRSAATSATARSRSGTRADDPARF